ncbi:hypothetical protein Bbelb_105640 [Branchiostoma belcheri]|nr:hypothetical protein Bbelb_105640 [Branchiostoma belcheri]
MSHRVLVNRGALPLCVGKDALCARYGQHGRAGSTEPKIEPAQYILPAFPACRAPVGANDRQVAALVKRPPRNLGVCLVIVRKSLSKRSSDEGPCVVFVSTRLRTRVTGPGGQKDAALCGSLMTLIPTPPHLAPQAS